MKEVKVLRTTFAAGDLLEAGKTYEVEDKVATDLAAVKKAEVIDSKKKAQNKDSKKEPAKEVTGDDKNPDGG